MKHVISVTDANFETEVLQKSHEITVLADFWAEWCGPCRMLGPLLEQLAAEYDGKFLLAKVNTEQAPNIAAQYHVQSIPTVYAIREGRIVDSFLGALPEPQIRQWIDRVLPSQSDQLVQAAENVRDTDPATAEQQLRQAFELDARNYTAQIRLAELLLDQDRIDECEAVIDELQRRGFLEPEAEKIKAALDVRRLGESSGDVQSCRAAVKADPQNLDLQLQLAEALIGEKHFQQALETLLPIVQNDQGPLREKARQHMVDIFRLLPADSEAVTEYRRKLSLALY